MSVCPGCKVFVGKRIIILIELYFLISRKLVIVLIEFCLEGFFVKVFVVLFVKFCLESGFVIFGLGCLPVLKFDTISYRTISLACFKVLLELFLIGRFCYFKLLIILCLICIVLSLFISFSL